MHLLTDVTFCQTVKLKLLKYINAALLYAATLSRARKSHEGAPEHNI